MMPNPSFGPDGLVPAVVQDQRTGQVLMVAYMNHEAVQATEDSGLAHFWSRSRQELWKKGATSGHVLRVQSAALDCDRDALLLTVDPVGPACHTGATSCFDQEAASAGQGFFDLETLWSTISDRADKRPAGSYTVELIEGGVDVTGRKVLEEAAEVVFAAKNHSIGTDDDERVAAEAADVIYHLLVLLAERGIAPHLVLDELARRAPGTGG